MNVLIRITVGLLLFYLAIPIILIENTSSKVIPQSFWLTYEPVVEKARKLGTQYDLTALNRRRLANDTFSAQEQAVLDEYVDAFPILTAINNAPQRYKFQFIDIPFSKTLFAYDDHWSFRAWAWLDWIDYQINRFSYYIFYLIFAVFSIVALVLLQIRSIKAKPELN